ncbi:MAG TPA: hypothetical protein DCK95_10610 [Anaerolineaceae bacterium]|nr:hypothetical protein [Anaerolineaceae bacterium]
MLILASLFSACIVFEPMPTSTPQATSTESIRTVAATATTSITPSATQTATLKPTETSIPTATISPMPLPYKLQSETPLYLQNFVHPDSGCGWMGVGGQVFSKEGEPVANLVVWIRGLIDNQPYEVVTLTGTSAGDSYGKAGFEAFLSSKPVTTSGIFSIQILDLNGTMLSEQVFFNTSAQCDQNLIIINFVEE